MKMTTTEAQRLREELGDHSQVEIARRLGVSKSAVSKWLDGTQLPSTKYQRRLVTEYGVSWDRVFARDEEWTHVWYWRLRPAHHAEPGEPGDDERKGQRCRVGAKGSVQVEMEEDGELIITGRRAVRRREQ
jgi:transcriptional regulator with XRE-family HTH domain